MKCGELVITIGLGSRKMSENYSGNTFNRVVHVTEIFCRNYTPLGYGYESKSLAYDDRAHTKLCWHCGRILYPEVHPTLVSLIKKRERLRLLNDYAWADKIRERLFRFGFIIRDRQTKCGVS